MFHFEKLKELECKSLFGIVETHNHYKNNQSIFSSNAKNNSINFEKIEKKEKYLQPGLSSYSLMRFIKLLLKKRLKKKMKKNFWIY